MRIHQIIFALALLIHTVAFSLMLRGIEPFSTFFYIFAWWTYILFISSVNHLTSRNSLLFDNPREFVWVFLFSTPLWLFFEIYNFRLNNWHYVGIPFEYYLRWPGYVISFGTVLPSILETKTLLANTGVFTRLQGHSIRVTRGLLVRFVLVGLLMMLFTPFRPDLFFPAVWVGGVLILDPILYRSKGRKASLLAQVERGNYSTFTQLLLSGLICGVLWEFWNYWAEAKWVYSIPYLDFLRIFELPILGFLGFASFALECYLFYQGFRLIRKRLAIAPRLVPLSLAFLTMLYCIVAFIGIDRWTVQMYKTAF